MIVTLLRPRYLAFKNRWAKFSTRKNRSQDVLIAMLGIVTALGTYAGTRWVLKHIASLPFLVYLPPQTPLGLILLLLLIMVSISSFVTALGSLYYSEDLETLLAAPVPSFSFYCSRVLSTLLNVAWMPFTFLFPLFVAFGVHYHADPAFYLAVLFVLVPYFGIPAVLGSILASLTMSVINPRWTKMIVGILMALVVYGAYHIVSVLAVSLDRFNDSGQTLQIVSFLSYSSKPYMPSSWVSNALSQILVPGGRSVVLHFGLLYSVLIGLLSLGYILFQVLHLTGYTRARNTQLRSALNSSRFGSVSRRALSPTLALWNKEFRGIFRDVAQSSQLIFLSCMCLLYLSNIKFLVSVDSFPVETRTVWRNIFFMFHSCVAAFFTVSISTRLVFSSVSLEGKSFWMIRTAPVSLSQILRAKFSFWYPPIAALSTIILALGAFTISERIDITLIHVVSSLLISFGIVGVGIGLGAYFADFTSDSAGHLVLGLGSFIFMLISVLLVFLNTIPTWFILQLSPDEEMGWAGFLSNRGALVLIALMIVALINITAARCALAVGERAIRNQ